MEFCDAHVHLFDTPDRTFGLTDLRQAAHPLKPQSIVFIECGQRYRQDTTPQRASLGETEWVAGIDDGGLVGAIMGRVDLAAPNLPTLLAEHVEVSRGKFRGVRQVAAWYPLPELFVPHWDTEPAMAAADEFVLGAKALGDAGLVLDLYVYSPQLADVVRLARAAPETVIVLEHLGGLLGVGPYGAPSQAQGYRDAWRSDLADIAACPNVNLKVSGLGRPAVGATPRTTARGPSATELAERWGADVRWAVETFGAQRCMFASIFPVDARALSYEQYWRSFELMTEDLSESERRRLFVGTAGEVYRIAATDATQGAGTTSAPAVNSLDRDLDQWSRS